MIRFAIVASALLTATFLAGCADEEPHAHGVLLTCDDGTVVDAANYTEHHDANFTLADQCPMPPPPAITVSLSLANASPYTFEPVAATWDITPLLPEGHSMLTELRVATTPGEGLGGPDSFGEAVVKHEHQNTPASFEGEWIPAAPGTYYLRAYAENQGTHFWSEPVEAIVQPVEPTGVVHTITVSLGGPTASLDPASLQMTVGDAVVWKNEDVVARQFVSTSGPAEFDSGEIARDAASEAIVLLAPGLYQYASQDQLSDLEELTGSIQVNLPG